MALAGVKFDSDSSGFVSNCFPVRGLLKRGVNEGDGEWLVEHRAEQRRRFKAILCAKPRTYSRIREERKRTEEQGVRLTAGQFQDEEEDKPEVPVLDGYFLMKHCCVEDPADLCSVNISGLELTDVKEEDFEMFDNVAYINAGENYLPFEAFRGFSSLRELEVPFNGLRCLKIQMNSFPHLEVLDLSYNNLSQDDVLTVGQLSSLRVLHLTGNNLHTLPPDMALPYLLPGSRKIHRPRFAKLEVLLLDDNNLADINIFAALAGLPKLRHINMEKNEIVCIPQLKYMEGHMVTYEGFKSKRTHSGRKSGRRPKSTQLGLPSTPVKQTRKKMKEEQLETDDIAGPQVVAGTNGKQMMAETTDRKTKDDELNIDELLKDDFSLGDLSERITELEEETAKAMESERETEAEKPQEDYVPKILPPFPELRYLNLAHNQIQDEEALLAVAAWPMLMQLVIHSNPLTIQHTGDPPLLKRFLSDRLGIRLQRKEEPRLVKPHIEIENSKSRTVSETIPKVPRSTIEERLHQLALEAPTVQQPVLDCQPSKSWLQEDQSLLGLDLETSKRMPLPPIPPTPPSKPTLRTLAWLDDDMIKSGVKLVKKVEREEGEGGRIAGPESDAFFMTQVEDPGEDHSGKPKLQMGQREEKKSKTAPAAKYRGFELLLEEEEDVKMEVELPKDIQGNVRALKHALGHQLVYRDPSVDLDRVKPTVQEYRRVPMPPAKPHKPRQERIDELLTSLRTHNSIDEESLNAVLKDKGNLTKRFPEAHHLLAQVQRRYNTVRCEKRCIFLRPDPVYCHCEHYYEKRYLPPKDKDTQSSTSSEDDGSESLEEGQYTLGIQDSKPRTSSKTQDLHCKEKKVYGSSSLTGKGSERLAVKKCSTVGKLYTKSSSSNEKGFEKPVGGKYSTENVHTKLSSSDKKGCEKPVGKKYSATDKLKTKSSSSDKDFERHEEDRSLQDETQSSTEKLAIKLSLSTEKGLKRPVEQKSSSTVKFAGKCSLTEKGFERPVKSSSSVKSANKECSTSEKGFERPVKKQSSLSSKLAKKLSTSNEKGFKKPS